MPSTKRHWYTSTGYENSKRWSRLYINLIFEFRVQIVERILDIKLKMPLDSGVRTVMAMWWISGFVVCDNGIIGIIIVRSRAWEMQVLW